MLKVLLVPSSDYLGHPFPQRHNQIFERLNAYRNIEVHVARFNLFPSAKLNTDVIIHDLPGKRLNQVAPYYLLNSISQAAKIKKIIRQERIDVVVLSNISAPFVFTLLNSLSSYNIPVVVDLPDYYPTSASGYLFNANSSMGKIVETTLGVLLSHIIKRADLVTVASKALKNYAIRAGAKCVSYVPNGIGECFLKTYNDSRYREELGYDPEDLIVGYIGSLEFWLDMRSLIEGVGLAKKKGLQIKLLLVGSNLYTGYLKRVKTWIREKNLERETKFLDFIPYDEVPRYMSQLDIGTIPFDVNNLTAYYSAPNKMWEYLSQKRPVFSSPIPEAQDNADCLFTVSSANDYFKHIQSIAKGDAESASKVKIGYERALTKTWKNSTAILASELKRVVEMTQK